jgi:hypothetical protein
MTKRHKNVAARVMERDQTIKGFVDDIREMGGCLLNMA